MFFFYIIIYFENIKNHHKTILRNKFILCLCLYLFNKIYFYICFFILEYLPNETNTPLTFRF